MSMKRVREVVKELEVFDPVYSRKSIKYYVEDYLIGEFLDRIAYYIERITGMCITVCNSGETSTVRLHGSSIAIFLHEERNPSLEMIRQQCDPLPGFEEIIYGKNEKP